jgi:hypothetical protein
VVFNYKCHFPQKVTFVINWLEYRHIGEHLNGRLNKFSLVVSAQGEEDTQKFDIKVNVS